MIRLNAFFEVKDNASVETVKKLGTELVNERAKTMATYPTICSLALHAH